MKIYEFIGYVSYKFILILIMLLTQPTYCYLLTFGKVVDRQIWAEESMSEMCYERLWSEALLLSKANF